MKPLLLLLLVSVACFSQQKDSLLYQLVNIPNDTERVNQLYQSGFDIRNSDPELAFQFAKVCEQEAKKCKSPKHLAKSYNLLGVLFYKKGNYTKALHYQKRSLDLNVSIQNDIGTAINHTNLGNIYSDINYFELAEASYLKALGVYNKLNNSLLIARSLINIGVLKYDQQQLEAAIHQFKEALIFANELKDYDLIASCDNNIGTILREQNKLDSALVYLEEALKLRDLIGNEVELADCYNNMANVFIQQKNFDQALNYLTLADSICTKYNYLEARVELYDTRSAYYKAQQNFEQALFWTQKHYELKDSLLNIEKEIGDTGFEDDITIQNQSENNGQIHNSWLLIVLSILLITIPLFLIRNKR